MTWGMIGGAAVSVIGGSLMSDGKSGSSTTKQEMDPRMVPYIFGDPGKMNADGTAMVGARPGLLGNVQDQLALSRSPERMQGWNNMMNRGQQLMGGSIAGNPFSAGYQGGANPGLFSGVRGSGNGMPQFTPQPLMQQPTQQSQAPTIDEIMAEIDRRKQNQPYDDYGMGIG